MKKLIQIAIALLSMSAAVGAVAANSECRFQLKPGMNEVSVDYREVVDVCLPSGQMISDIHVGPTNGWEIDANKSTGRIMVRLLGVTAAGAADLNTNIIVWSAIDTRYEIKLSSRSPASAAFAAQAVPNFTVRLAEPPHFVPTKVWDDNGSTFIELPAAMKEGLPLIFAVAEDGQSQLVNWRWDESKTRFILPSGHKHFKLVLGNQWVMVDLV
ncbi:TrbG/VirB9 family P-type conjugative transfer protein [Rugamonas sp. A1-17]|nr:TrbG/VirB9 family P-type conjugative transfer protein [Rugamonas sp. A1-17]